MPVDSEPQGPEGYRRLDQVSLAKELEKNDILVVVRRGEFEPENSQADLLTLSKGKVWEEGWKKGVSVKYEVVEFRDTGERRVPLELETCEETLKQEKKNVIAMGKFDLSDVSKFRYSEKSEPPIGGVVRASYGARWARVICDLEIKEQDLPPGVSKILFGTNMKDDAILLVYSVPKKELKSNVLDFSVVQQKVAA